MNFLRQYNRRLFYSIFLLLFISFAVAACQTQSAQTDAPTATASVTSTVRTTTAPVTQASTSTLSALTSINATVSTTQASTAIAATTIAATTTVATTIAATTTVATTTKAPAPKLTGAFVAADLLLTIDGQSFAMMSDAAPLLKKIGDKYQKTEAESCLFKGFDKTFDYGYVQVFTIPNEKLDLIDGIYIMDNRFQTARGIKVGDTQAAVTAAYGKKTGAAGLVYNQTGDPDNIADPSLTFVLEGEKIVAISYYSGSNSQGTAGGG